MTNVEKWFRDLDFRYYFIHAKLSVESRRREELSIDFKCYLFLFIKLNKEINFRLILFIL